jgi:hypothetical protein
MRLKQVLYQRPAHSQQGGYMLDRRNPAEIYDVPLEGLDLSAFSFSERYGLSTFHPTSATQLLVAVQNDELPFRPHRQGTECPFETALKNQFVRARSAFSTFPTIKR